MSFRSHAPRWPGDSGRRPHPITVGEQAVEGSAKVEQFVEGTVGAMSDNEYFEVKAANAVGLPA